MPALDHATASNSPDRSARALGAVDDDRVILRPPSRNSRRMCPRFSGCRLSSMFNVQQGFDIPARACRSTMKKPPRSPKSSPPLARKLFGRANAPPARVRHSDEPRPRPWWIRCEGRLHDESAALGAWRRPAQARRNVGVHPHHLLRSLWRHVFPILSRRLAIHGANVVVMGQHYCGTFTGWEAITFPSQVFRRAAPKKTVAAPFWM